MYTTTDRAVTLQLYGDGDPSGLQYTNVTLAEEMSLVGNAHLEAVQRAEPAPEGTPSDLLDGLLVAQDLLWKTLPQDGKADKHDRRIVLARCACFP